MEQTNWITDEDNLAAAARYLQEGAERVGIPEIAHLTKEDPSTIRNQLAHRERKRPSAEIAAIVHLRDARYRQQMAGLTGEMLIHPPDLTPEEVVRLLAVEAQTNGYVPKERVAELLARMGTAERAGLKAVGT